MSSKGNEQKGWTREPLPLQVTQKFVYGQAAGANNPP